EERGERAGGNRVRERLPGVPAERGEHGHRDRQTENEEEAVLQRRPDRRCDRQAEERAPSPPMRADETDEAEEGERRPLRRDEGQQEDRGPERRGVDREDARDECGERTPSELAHE